MGMTGVGFAKLRLIGNLPPSQAHGGLQVVRGASTQL